MASFRLLRSYFIFHPLCNLRKLCVLNPRPPFPLYHETAFRTLLRRLRRNSRSCFLLYRASGRQFPISPSCHYRIDSRIYILFLESDSFSVKGANNRRPFSSLVSAFLHSGHPRTLALHQLYGSCQRNLSDSLTDPFYFHTKKNRLTPNGVKRFFITSHPSCFQEFFELRPKISGKSEK